MDRIVLLAAFGLLAFQAQGQDSFEVVSIKPSDPASRGMGVNTTPGGLLFKNVPLRFLVQFGYDVQDFQVLGAAGWMDSEKFDIAAKGNPGQPLSMENSRSRVRAMLADRFRMAAHEETRQLPVYELVVGKKGTKLRATSIDGNSMVMNRGKLTAEGANMDQLGRILSNLLGKPVLDKTGLAGKFDFELAWTPDDAERMKTKPGVAPALPVAAADDSGPSIFTALEETLGLKLQSGKGPVRVVVVESAERPSEN